MAIGHFQMHALEWRPEPTPTVPWGNTPDSSPSLAAVNARLDGTGAQP